MYFGLRFLFSVISLLAQQLVHWG